MSNKIKLLTISDIPLCNSGVGNQAMILFKGLLNTGRYIIRAIGGALNHSNMTPVIIDKEKYNDDYIVFPVKDFGDAMYLRQMIEKEKPDGLFLFTDPRFFIWIWEMADEILPRMPIYYWHLWDNYPIPKFNKLYYDSCSFIGCINKQTTEFVKGSGSKTHFEYIPHTLPEDIYFPLEENLNMENRKKIFGANSDKCIFFYAGRNARRKGVSNILEAFSWLKNKYQDVFLCMHCDPNDKEGPQLIEVSKMLGLVGNIDIIFMINAIPINHMRELYNAIDFNINASNAEGFGLVPFEGMHCGTRCIVNYTGGLKDQLIAPELGRYMQPDARFVAGSQLVPYIYDDYLNSSTIYNAMETEYLEWKRIGRESLREKTISKIPLLKENFNHKKMIESWDRNIIQTREDWKEAKKIRKIFVGEF